MPNVIRVKTTRMNATLNVTCNTATTLRTSRSFGMGFNRPVAASSFRTHNNCRHRQHQRQSSQALSLSATDCGTIRIDRTRMAGRIGLHSTTRSTSYRNYNNTRRKSRSNRLDAVSMGNPNTTGIFAPIVRVTRNIIGVKNFNKLRGNGIKLHSQVITEFCKTIGAPAQTRQKLIKTAKDNGGKLGFLA